MQYDMRVMTSLFHSNYYMQFGFFHTYEKIRVIFENSSYLPTKCEYKDIRYYMADLSLKRKMSTIHCKNTMGLDIVPAVLYTTDPISFKEFMDGHTNKKGM